MALGNERIEKIDHTMESVNRRMSKDVSEKRLDQLFLTFRRLEALKTETKLETLRDKKVLIIDSPWITNNLPDYIARAGIRIFSKQSFKHLDVSLTEEEFDGALIHMVSTSDDSTLREMSNRILKAALTGTKIVVMYGNYPEVKQDVSVIFQLFDSVGVEYVPKWSEGIKEGFLKLSELFEEDMNSSKNSELK